MNRCPVCGAELDSAEALAEHTATVHGEPAPIEAEPAPASGGSGWRIVALVVLVAVIALIAGFLLAGGGDDDDEDPPSSTTTSETSTTTSSTTTTVSTTTTAPTTTEAALVPGQDCALGSDPDCIDPEGDGSGTYLIGGADCMAGLPDSPELCSDLDGDGNAGYPDSG